MKITSTNLWEENTNLIGSIYSLKLCFVQKNLTKYF